MQSVYVIEKELEFLEEGAEAAKETLEKLAGDTKHLSTPPPLPTPSSADEKTSNLEQLSSKIDAMRRRVERAERERRIVAARRKELMGKVKELMDLRENVDELCNHMLLRKVELDEDTVYANRENNRYKTSLNKLMHINAYNDTFYIWFSGPYATINGLRLGRIPFIQPIVEWPEINGALGQAALAMSAMAKKIEHEFAFEKYDIVPFGSFSMITRVDDSSATLNLYTDGNFGYFTGKGSFNKALVAFVCCIEELGTFVSSKDPTIPIPHAITADGNKVGDLAIQLGTDYEIWTRALKYAITDIKWIIASILKHYPN
jgi:beclin